MCSTSALLQWCSAPTRRVCPRLPLAARLQNLQCKAHTLHVHTHTQSPMQEKAPAPAPCPLMCVNTMIKTRLGLCTDGLAITRVALYDLTTHEQPQQRRCDIPSRNSWLLPAAPDDPLTCLPTAALIAVRRRRPPHLLLYFSSRLHSHASAGTTAVAAAGTAAAVAAAACPYRPGNATPRSPRASWPRRPPGGARLC